MILLKGLMQLYVLTQTVLILRSVNLAPGHVSNAWPHYQDQGSVYRTVTGLREESMTVSLILN